jgi:transglutaminase-like putative cysteine protease
MRSAKALQPTSIFRDLMRLNIRHETFYTYETQLSYSVQRLYLTPQGFAAQKIIDWNIIAPGMDGALSYLDGFGNRVHLVTFQNIIGPVSVAAEGTVDVTDASGVVKGLSCPAPDAIFLRQTDATRPSPEILGMVGRVKSSRDTQLDLMHGLMTEIADAVTYKIGVTDANTTAAQAFAAGQGVCQDHAHIFLGAVRHLQIPARYVTGYLALEGGESATASHAWAEALLPDLGWVGFDPANRRCPTDHYVRVAGGIDANGITPIRGSRKGGNAEKMRVEVNVDVAQQ